MKTSLIPYLTWIDFLSDSLGSGYELTLYELELTKGCLVAVRNGYISGASMGSAPPPFVVQSIEAREFQTRAYREFFYESPYNGRIIRLSAYFIKNMADQLEGVLCIGSCIDLSKGTMQQVEMRALQNMPTTTGVEEYVGTLTAEEALSISEIVSQRIATVLNQFTISGSRASLKEKKCMIEALYKAEIFQAKGAIPLVAEQLGVSDATVYRYLRTLLQKNADDFTLTYLM